MPDGPHFLIIRAAHSGISMTSAAPTMPARSNWIPSPTRGPGWRSFHPTTIQTKRETWERLKVHYMGVSAPAGFPKSDACSRLSTAREAR
jgi:hypothetical protein